MIIVDKTKKKYQIPRWLPLLIIVGGIISYVIFTWLAYKNYTAISADEMILCDAEYVENKHFITGDYACDGGKQQSKEEAYQGRFSVKVNDENKYALGVFIPVSTNESVIVSVWRKYADDAKSSKAYLVLEEDNPSDDKRLYYQKEAAVEQGENGWERVEIRVPIYADWYNNQMKIFVYVGEGEAYFDMLTVRKETINPEDQWVPEKAQLVIKSDEMAKLENKRSQALEQGLLVTGNDDWVKAKLQTKGDESTAQNVEIRLKGDWLDHLRGDKWSFRIKAKDFNAWNRLRVFSFQNSSTRHHLKEWVLHQWFLKEDILSPRYDFIDVYLNNQHLGVYAYEEHFVKQLPEFHLRREGPIVKFAENGLWDLRRRAIDELGGFQTPFEHQFEAEDIVPFSENKTINTPKLAEQYEIAQNLMYSYRIGAKKVSEVFDIERLASYFAIMDIMGAHHGLIWHNQRFYYNPVIGKLEPIGYDGFDETGESWLSKPYYGYYFINKGHRLVDYIFDDEEFMALYIQRLAEFSNVTYLDSLLNDLNVGLYARQEFIKSEFPNYEWEEGALRDRVEQIAFSLEPLNDVSLKVNRQSSGDSLHLALTNNHPLPIEIIGTGYAADAMNQPLNTPIIVKPQRPKAVLEPTYINAVKSSQYVFFRVLGLEKVHSSEIKAWSLPEVTTPMQELLAGTELVSNGVYQVGDDVILFQGGEHTIEEDIIIPAGYEVRFEEGVTLDFINRSKFISYSAVDMAGTADFPIRIHSSDSSANGFTILQAAERSRLRYVSFEHFNTLNYQGWELTGAVTFYESDVDFYHCTFTRNHCEDALNTVRSNFNMYHSTVSHTAADGFDLDFCVGYIQDSYFYKTGNDGVDCSTSQLRVKDCVLKKIGDKGISVGEESHAIVEMAEVEGAVIGVAAKDFSTLKIDNIILKSCNNGFSAYQKKPEYGGATIKVKQYTAENIEFLTKKDEASTIDLGEQ